MHDFAGPHPPGDHPVQLAPGLRVVARGHDHLQVGLYTGRRVLLPRTEAVEATLEALLNRGDLDGDLGTESVLDRLDGRGCLSRRDEQVERERRRRAGRVAVLGTLAGVDATDLFARAAVEVVASTGPADRALEHADVVLVLCRGELPREHLDPLVRRGTSHLVLRLVDGMALVGPFVVPGLTACL